MIVAEGEENKLKQLVQWCQQGPITAQVNKVTAEWQTANGQYKSFFIAY